MRRKSYHGQGRVCKCGGLMKKRACFTEECRVWECMVCGRRNHYGIKPKDCEAKYP